MRSRFLVAALSAIVVGLFASAPAQALNRHCAESGDYCAYISSPPTQFSLLSFAFSGKYTITVTPPRGEATTKTFTLKRKADLYKSTVRWSKHFPNRGKGVYTVVWKLQSPATTLATLKFKR